MPAPAPASGPPQVCRVQGQASPKAVSARSVEARSASARVSRRTPPRAMRSGQSLMVLMSQELYVGCNRGAEPGGCGARGSGCRPSDPSPRVTYHRQIAARAEGALEAKGSGVTRRAAVLSRTLGAWSWEGHRARLKTFAEVSKKLARGLQIRALPAVVFTCESYP